MSNSLATTAISELSGVGEQLLKRLAKLGIHSVQDALFHLPYQYEDRTRTTPIASLRLGQAAVFQGTVVHSETIVRRRRSLQCIVEDETGSITLRFFHFGSSQRNQLSVGKHIRCYGEPRQGNRGLEVFHPECTPIKDPDSPPPENTLSAMYPSTEGLNKFHWRRINEQILQLLNEQPLPELLPPGAAPLDGAPSLQQALNYLHAPPPNADLQLLARRRHPCQRRLVFEELLAHFLVMQSLRTEKRQQRAPALPADRELQTRFMEQFGYPLTGAQQRARAEIDRDLCQQLPMLRLLQGDVGSGKTVIAALAALQAIANNHQAVVMAPTEILAEQHYLLFSQWLLPLGLRLTWLTSRVKGRSREQTLSLIAGGEAQLIVGTHALLQEDVQFARLGLVVIDEQHRFGVHQRLILREKGSDSATATVPHQLVMTATPIPRTLLLASYADLDQSRLDELPPGRKPVETRLGADLHRQKLIDWIRKFCLKTGQQVYWVCTLIEESEELQCQAAETTHIELGEKLPELRVGLIHGRHGSKDKAATMEAFKSGAIDLLVATTVVEVGVDIANATVMVIENPERLGLAQLHQLRGRVGRGAAKSYCMLLHGSPLSEAAQQRLQVMRECNDGFEIAEKDLEMRGPGEILGTRQAGLVDFRIADLQRDAELLPEVHRYGHWLWQHHPDAATALIHRWVSDDDRLRQA